MSCALDTERSEIEREPAVIDCLLELDLPLVVQFKQLSSYCLVEVPLQELDLLAVTHKQTELAVLGGGSDLREDLLVLLLAETCYFIS